MLALIFDTETTGIPKHPKARDEVQPRVIEFAGLLIDEQGGEVDRLEFLCNPGQPLEEIITKITGLTDDDLADQPPFADFMGRLAALFERADALVAHNLPFDRTLIELELARLGNPEFPWPRINVCTVQENAERWGRRPKLTELYQEVVGEPLAQTHRAMDDVEALARVVVETGVLHDSTA